jgi:hypothetical protein
MRIENTFKDNSLSYGEYEYPAANEEAIDPYDNISNENDTLDVYVRMPENLSENNLDFDFGEFNVDRFVLSEEEEMLLDFLLPSRQANRNRCI